MSDARRARWVSVSAVLVVVLLAVVALRGCASDPVRVPVPTPTATATVTVSTTVTPSPSPPSRPSLSRRLGREMRQALEALEQAAREFWAGVQGTS